MIVNLKQFDRIIPEWNDNKKQKAENQITVKIKFLNTLEYEDLFITDGEDVKFDSKKHFIESIVEIKNLSVVIDGKEKKIKTGEDILKTPGLELLFSELSIKIKKLTVFDKKK